MDSPGASSIGKPDRWLGTQISLFDNTIPRDIEPALKNTDTNASSLTHSTTTRTQRYGAARLREELARRKYAKYQEARYAHHDHDRESHASTASSSHATALPNKSNPHSPVEDVINAPAAIGPTTATFKDSRRRGGQKKLRGLLPHRQRHDDATPSDTYLDELYENQRGSFVFGMPLYSSASLLNFDAAPWVDGALRRSLVDVTDAQLPDPGWEWAWRSWYVDMTGDVDEQGWQYSFSFHERFPWHGTHPWLYSFVRRRRWLRKRVRKHQHTAGGAVVGGPDAKAAHKLNADYFTVRAKRSRSPGNESLVSDEGGSFRHEATAPRDSDGPVDDIPTMVQRLKAAPVDRDKVNIVLEYLDHEPHDRYRLADEVRAPFPSTPIPHGLTCQQMPHIMSLFIFQFSRRKLLAKMTQKIGLTPKDEEEGAGPASPEGGPRRRRNEDLTRAAHAADEQIRQLEFWSDIRRTVREGDSYGATDAEQGWGEDWQGVDESGPGGHVAEATRPEPE